MKKIKEKNYSNNISDEEKNIVRKSLLYYLDIINSHGIDTSEYISFDDKIKVKKYDDGSYRTSFNYYSDNRCFSLRVFAHLTDDNVGINITEQTTIRQRNGVKLINKNQEVTFTKPEKKDLELIKKSDNPVIIEDYISGETRGIVIFRDRIIHESKDLIDKDNISEIRNHKKKEVFSHKAIIKLVSTNRDISLSKISKQEEKGKKLIKTKATN